MIDMTDEIPNRATFIGESMVYANPITGIWNVWGKWFCMTFQISTQRLKKCSRGNMIEIILPYDRRIKVVAGRILQGNRKWLPWPPLVEMGLTMHQRGKRLLQKKALTKGPVNEISPQWEMDSTETKFQVDTISSSTEADKQEVRRNRHWPLGDVRKVFMI